MFHFAEPYVSHVRNLQKFLKKLHLLQDVFTLSASQLRCKDSSNQINMQLICSIYHKGPSEILPDSPSHQEKVVLTTPRDLQIFSFFQFIIRIAFHILVTTLLIQSLCIKQIAHRAGACFVIIGIQAEILGGLLNGQTGNLHLLPRPPRSRHSSYG